MALINPSSESQPPVKVFWSYASEDRAGAEALVRMARVLEAQGLIQTFAIGDISPGEPRIARFVNELADADILVFLLSPASLASSWLASDNVRRVANSKRVLTVPLRPAPIPYGFFGNLRVPAQDIESHKDPDAARLEVIRAIEQMALSIRTERQPSVVAEPESPAYGPTPNINEIFRLNGPPTVNFVEPPRFPEIRLELRTMGTGLIVEGPSKIGKTTAVKKALEAMGVPESAQIWWAGQAPPPLAELIATLDGLIAGPDQRWLFIDDFHWLVDPEYLRALAFRMKKLADLARPAGKVTLIGINPLGSSLAQAMPDLAGRFRVIRLDRDKTTSGTNRIVELITRGESAANIRFTRRDDFVITADGSFYLAQFLCNEAAKRAGIMERAPSLTTVNTGPTDVIRGIQDELATRYRGPMLEFATFDEAPPPRGAGLSLLWLLSRNAEGSVSVTEAKLRFPALATAFDWFLASNLTRCISEHPELKGLVYYHRGSGNLSLEDPQLRFYLRELDWVAFARDSGHGPVSFHPEDGPLWTAVRAPKRAGTSERRWLLHLSDLHFGTTVDEAEVAYAKLADDLRTQGCERLDGAVVSGDFVQFARPDEYRTARYFVARLMDGFGLDRKQVVLAPGNHDVSWLHSDSAYVPRKVRSGAPLPPAGTFIQHGDTIIEERQEDDWRRRFDPFASFYEEVTGEAYPLDPADQGIVRALPGGIAVLALNSAWETDHHFPSRASIHPTALARGLQALPDAALKVAVFHHPISSEEDARLKDTAFLQQLATHGFRLILHGHVHRSESVLYRYDHSVGGRSVDIVGAGTFGAPTREWTPGYPLQYNLLRVEGGEVTVETRCRTEVNGAWKPDARWLQGAGKDPLPRYSFTI